MLILHLWSGSEHILYHGFETLVTKLYWAFVVPLAATFDWMRKMFEKGKAIREAKKAEILAKMREQVQEQVREQVLREEHERIRAALASSGVSLAPEVAARVFGENSGEK